jgi:glycosyltransferase involved in cell wall biosynthesis
LQIPASVVLMLAVIQDCSKAKMKLLVFAHKPPPHHGQSYMVQLLLEHLESECQKNPNSSIQYYHIDSRVSTSVEDMGRARWSKLLPLIKYCVQAIWIRWRHGVRIFYYIPAPPAPKSALFRDWVVMSLCRPFFPVVIFHWHAAGLGQWLARNANPWKKWITCKLLGAPDLSIVLSQYNQSDALELHSQRIIVVANGIPDPCPNFEKEVLPKRINRIKLRQGLIAGGACPPNEQHVFRVLFIGICTASKGLFDAAQAIMLLHEKINHLPIRVQLTVAGNFGSNAERIHFEKLAGQHNRDNEMPLLDYRGFVSGETKSQLFFESDCLCFPTYYPAESFGLVLLEAMAFGLPIVTTRWRSIPELLPPGYSGLVEPQAPKQIADKLFALLHEDYDPRLRAHFLGNYTAEKFGEHIKNALLSVEP